MTFKKVPLHLITPYEDNAKQHPIEQLEELRKNVQKFGFRGSILLDKDNVIIAGHARYEAATALGLADVMCEYANDLTDEEVKEYRIKDNLIAEMGYTDFVKLQAELQKIPDADFSAWDFDFSKEIEHNQDSEGESEHESKLVTCPKCEHRFVKGS